MPASDYLDRKLLEWAFASQAFPAALAGSRYVALYTAAPTKSGGGTEVSGLGYARLATSDADWSVSGPLWVAANAVTLTFPTPLGLWGTLVAFGLLDQAAGGNLLWFSLLSAQRTPLAGQPIVFGVGALQVQGRAS